jgi:threonyl-tRNA synthetase
MIHVNLPDGATRALSDDPTAAGLAADISKSLAKRTVAAVVNGVLSDLSAPLPDGATVELIDRDDPRALELIRHDLAHVLAEAVQSLWPDAKTAIGPATEHGFLYDFERDALFTPEDLPAIDKKMREIIAARTPFTCEVWTRDRAKAHFEEAGETWKLALLDAIPEAEPVKIYRQGDWLDLCRGPHMRHTGDAGTAFKLTHVAGAYWRGDAKNPMLSRIYGIAFADSEALSAHEKMMAEAEKRDHRRLGREMDLFHFEEVAPGSVFWHPRGWRLFQALIGYMRDRQEEAGYVEVNSPDIMDRALWETSGHWQNYREHMFLAQTQDDRDYALKPMNCPG